MSQEFWPWWLGGIAVSFVAIAQPLFTGRLLGVSSLYGALVQRGAAPQADLSELERALLEETEREFGPSASQAEADSESRPLARTRAEADRRRPLFLAGIVLGGYLASALSNESWLSLSLGSLFDARYGEFGIIPVSVLLLSGVLIGIGTRLGAGCTSGHGISGVARGERGSLLTTAVFWSTALAVTWLIVGLGRAP